MVEGFNAERFILYCADTFEGFDNALMRSITKNAINLVKEEWETECMDYYTIQTFVDEVVRLFDFDLEDEEVIAFFEDRDELPEDMQIVYDNFWQEHDKSKYVTLNDLMEAKHE